MAVCNLTNVGVLGQQGSKLPIRSVCHGDHRTKAEIK